MADTDPTSSVPAPDAGAPPAERAPDAEPKEAPSDPVPSAVEQEPVKEGKIPEEKPSDDTAASPQEQKEQQETPSEVPAAPAEPSDAKEPEAPQAEPAAPAEPAPTEEANGTPASAKKGKSSKRRSSGIAEHKSKQNKKKPQTRVTHLNAKPGEYYLSRLRSYPAWPSIICDEEMLPQSILETRPVTAMRPDGTYREDYADEGRRAHERTFPVMFFGTNEFAWIPNMCLSPITPEECKDVSEKGKNKSLLNAYEVASQGHDLQHCKQMLADHQHALQLELENKEAKAAAKAEKQAKKNKRKSTDVVDDEDLEMEDVDEAPKKSKSSKKRKKEADAGESEKPAKTPKTATKLKLTTPKTPASETEKTPSRAKRSGGARKSAKEVSSDEDESGLEPKDTEEIDPQEAKAKRDKEVLYIRHKLQKGFISRDQPPKEEDMNTMSNYFTKLESYSDLEVSIIRHTKIHKVLRMIVKLSSIPRDEDFHFKQRAMDILSKWRNVLDSDTTGLGDEKEKETKPTANGLQKEGSAETPPKADTEEEKEVEPKPEKEASQVPEEPMPDADATEKVQTREPVKEVSDEPVPKEGEATEEKAEEKPVEAAA